MTLKKKRTLPPALKSRKLWLAVISALVVFLNSAFDIGLNQQDIVLMLTPVLSYIGVEGIRDIKES